MCPAFPPAKILSKDEDNDVSKSGAFWFQLQVLPLANWEIAIAEARNTHFGHCLSTFDFMGFVNLTTHGTRLCFKVAIHFDNRREDTRLFSCLLSPGHLNPCESFQRWLQHNETQLCHFYKTSFYRNQTGFCLDLLETLHSIFRSNC